MSGRPVLRDFACADSTKGDYYWAPIDLLVLSGVLSPQHDLRVIDGVVERLSADEVVRRSSDFRPDAIFALTSTITLAGDDAQLGRIKARTGARVYGLGDVASFAPDIGFDVTRHFDGFVQNFADPSLTDLVRTGQSGVSGVVFRDVAPERTPPQRKPRPMAYAVPRHDLFPLDRYRMPFDDAPRTTTVLTSYGCPYPCTFCTSNKLPSQVRAIEDVVEELESVRALGIRDVYIRDFSFGPTRQRARELCQAMIDADVGIRWSAECRIELLDDDVLRLMRRAGCDVILVGVETGDADVARALGKKLDQDRYSRAFRTARELGIRVCGHFLVGAPGETREQAARTFRYARSLPIDYASFNLYAPRLGTPLRERLVEEGRVGAGELEGQDVSSHANGFSAMRPDELRRLFTRGVLGFYFRPRQAVRLLRVTPLSTLGRQGAAVVRNLLGPGSH